MGHARVSRAADAVWAVAAGAYVAGLLLWLALGLLPPVVASVGPAHHLASRLAAGSGPLRPVASAVLMHLPTLREGLDAGVQYLFSLLNLALGLLLAVRRPRDPVARLMTLAFVGTAATFNEPSHEVFHLLGGAPLVEAVHFTFHVVSGVAYLWAVLVFPDGRLPARRLRPLAVVGTVAVALVCWRSSFLSHPPFFVAFFGVLVPLVGIAAQEPRVRHGSAVVRAQSRLLRAALTPALAAATVWSVARVVGADGVAAHVQAAFPGLFAVVPLVLFVAVLRHRLFGLELVLSRAVLYGCLVAAVGGLYAAVLATASQLVGSSAPAHLAALVVVALAVEPARAWSRRLANRLVHGQEVTPREALRDLAERLTRTGSPGQLDDLTGVVVAATRCTGAELWLVLPGRLLLTAAAPGTSRPERLPLAEATEQGCAAALPDRHCLPVRSGGRLLGVLAVRVPPRVALPAAELRLLEELAGSAGLLVANAQLVAELAAQLERVSARRAELARSRREVVHAQDAERRRLERDIHDGAQQELVAGLVQLGALRRAPDRSGQLLPGLVDLLEQAEATLTELSAGRAPAVLRDHGLGAALEEAADTARAGGLGVDVDCRVTGRLPLDVETVICFCCREALQNAAKHAGGARVRVEVALHPPPPGGGGEPEVVFEVSDDGVGFDPATVRAGSGASTLRERLAALAGTAEVVSAPGAGTRVRGRVPLPALAPLPAQADLLHVPEQPQPRREAVPW